MNKRALKTMIVALVAVGLVATVLTMGCGSSTTTKVPATTTTVKATTTTTHAATTTTGQAAADGKAVYAQYCASCHANAVGKVSASDLAKIESIIKSGKGSMPGFADNLSASQIAAIATYLTTSN